MTSFLAAFPYEVKVHIARQIGLTHIHLLPFLRDFAAICDDTVAMVTMFQDYYGPRYVLCEILLRHACRDPMHVHYQVNYTTISRIYSLLMCKRPLLRALLQSLRPYRKDPIVIETVTSIIATMTCIQDSQSALTHGMFLTSPLVLHILAECCARQQLKTVSLPCCLDEGSGRRQKKLWFPEGQAIEDWIGEPHNVEYAKRATKLCGKRFMRWQHLCVQDAVEGFFTHTNALSRYKTFCAALRPFPVLAAIVDQHPPTLKQWRTFGDLSFDCLQTAVAHASAETWFHGHMERTFHRSVVQATTMSWWFDTLYLPFCDWRRADGSRRTEAFQLNTLLRRILLSQLNVAHLLEMMRERYEHHSEDLSLEDETIRLLVSSTLVYNNSAAVCETI